MKEYSSWSQVPSNYKTKNSLIKRGIYKTGAVVAKVVTEEGVYELYNADVALAYEKQKGNKNLSIDTDNEDDFLIMEMATTGDSSSDEIIQLVLLDMKGQLLINQFFKPMKEISKAAMMKHQISAFYLKSMPRWDEVWGRIKEYVQNRIILIPNTSYGKRLFEQTCKRYDIPLNFELNFLCSRETIQHKFTIMSLFQTSKTEIQNPISDSYETLKMLYPKSPLYIEQSKAKNYFDLFCRYKIKNGDTAAYEKGYAWLQKEFRLSSEELDFDTMSYEVCHSIVENLETPLRGLGIIKS